MSSNDYVPHWACRQWGQYEHDWLDCPECLEAYEASLAEDIKQLEETHEETRRTPGPEQLPE